MLEFDDRKHAAAQLIAALPCQVELPAEWRNNFEKRGAVPFSDGDRRRYPRVYCRSQRNRGGLQYQSTLPRLPRENGWHSVYLTNLSRDGLGFLHSEALYPREQMRMVTLNGVVLKLEIVCCRRVSTRCFEIGAQICGQERFTD